MISVIISLNILVTHVTEIIVFPLFAKLNMLITTIGINMLIGKKLTNIIPFLTARNTILCTRRLQSPLDDCTVRVQRFSTREY